MLTSLTIRDLALVDKLTWQPGPGFSSVTGETGAGKSVLIGAIGLALGDRADKTLIRHGADSASVEAVFSLPSGRLADKIQQTLDAAGIEIGKDSAEIILKRQISIAGQSRQWINGSATTLALLREIGEYLVDFHGPHEHQSLLNTSTQRQLLDEFAGASELSADVAKAWARACQYAKEYEWLSNQITLGQKELEELKYAYNEITQAALNDAEEEDISTRLSLASHGARLLEICASLTAHIEDSPQSIQTVLQQIQRLIKELCSIDGSPATEEIAALAFALQANTSELGSLVTRYADQIDSDPAQLAALSERYNLIQSLKRKYGSSITLINNRAKEAAEKIARYENRDFELAAALKNRDEASQEHIRLASQLSDTRKSAAKTLSRQVTTLLKELNFPQAIFEISLKSCTPGPHGFEEVEFLFAPNPGEGIRPLRAIASSGEMARVMLAIKTCLAAHDNTPLLVFDEVDANVGGETSLKIGALLKELGARHQVLCITHLPQVASAAHTQYLVGKKIQDGRTTTYLKRLDPNERLEELCRMLGASTSEARLLAASLMGTESATESQNSKKNAPNQSTKKSRKSG